MLIQTTWTNDNPDTIYNRLATKLGREPSNAELIADVRRIKSEVQVDLAGKGKLAWQRRR